MTILFSNANLDRRCLDRRCLMRGVGAAAIWSAADSAGLAKTRLPPDDDPAFFQTMVLAVLRRRYPGRVFEPGPTPIEILSPPHHLYLSNIFVATRRLPPEAREPAIAAWFEALDKPGGIDREALWKDWALAAPLVRPRLLSRTMHGIERLARRTFVADLVIVYVIDTPTAAIYINDTRRSDWMVAQDQLHVRALDNLKAASGTLPIEAETFEGSTQEVVRIRAADTYDAARILLPSIRDNIHALLGPIVLAAIPDRDVFIAWPNGYSQRAKLNASIAAIAQDGTHPLCPDVLCLERGEVRVANDAERDDVRAGRVTPQAR